VDVSVELDPLGGTLAVSTKPPGATISVDGVVQTKKTPAILKLAPGNRQVVLSLPGHPPHEETVEIRDGITWGLSFDFGESN
jgi:hypothetical protein